MLVLFVHNVSIVLIQFSIAWSKACLHGTPLQGTLHTGEHPSQVRELTPPVDLCACGKITCSINTFLKVLMG